MTDPNDPEVKRLRRQLAIERQKNRKLRQQLLTRAADVDELRAKLDKAQQRTQGLQADNKELLAIADPSTSSGQASALILAHHHAGDLEQQLADIRAAVVGTRTYVASHNLSIGECVAWNDLKKLAGIYGDPISSERYISPLSSMHSEALRRAGKEQTE